MMLILLFRPIAGYVNFCPSALANIDDDTLFIIVKHEILHALVNVLLNNLYMLTGTSRHFHQVFFHFGETQMVLRVPTEMSLDFLLKLQKVAGML